MTQNAPHDVEIIANALLQVSDTLLEVSADHEITRIWESNLSRTADSAHYIGKKISDTDDEVFRRTDDVVTSCFALRDNNIEYITLGEGTSSTFSVRGLSIHPERDLLFVAIKRLAGSEEVEFAEDKWRLALDAAGDGMWDLNLQTGRILFSAKWHEIFGYKPSEISTWDEWVAKIHPEDQARYKQRSQEHIAGKSSSYSVEQRFLCSDGTYKWILSRGIIIARTPDGRPLRAVGTHHDINSRKLAEEALKISKDTFASVFDYSGIGIALIAPGGKWLDVNHVICDLTGYSKEELLQLHHFDVTYPEDRDIDRELIDQMLDKEIYTYTIEKRYVNKNKKVFLGLLTVSLVWNNDNTPKFFITQVMDITKKKEFEIEIKKKNAELEAAKVSLTNKIRQLEDLNNIIVNQLKEPADNIHELADVLLAKSKGHKSVSASILNNALSQDQALERIRTASSSMAGTLSSLMMGAGQNKG